MRKNKAFKKIIDEETNVLLEQDKEFHDKIIYDYYAGKEKKNNKKVFPKLAFICAPLVLFICALSVGLGFYFGRNAEVAPTEYFERNEKSVTVTLEQFNKDLKYTKFNLPENCEIAIELFYDSISGDHLFYYVMLSDTIEIRTANIFVKVNERYEKDYESFTDKLANINGLKVKYTAISECDVDGIYSHKMEAIVRTDLDFYRITYQEVSFEENSKFLDFISQTIFKK